MIIAGSRGAAGTSKDMGPKDIFKMGSSVMSLKNATKVVRYISVQLSFLNNTMSMVSGVSKPMTENRKPSAFFVLLSTRHSSLQAVFCPLASVSS
jgi:hypothetical protein